MRVNRTRAAVVGAMSAAVLVGMPVAMAAPVVASPVSQDEDPPPDDGVPLPAPEGSSALELEVLPPASSNDAPSNTPQDSSSTPAPAQDLTEPLEPVTQPLADVTAPVTETAQPVLDLNQNVTPAADDSEEGGIGPAAPQGPAGGSGGDGGQGGDAESSGDNIPSGELGPSSNAPTAEGQGESNQACATGSDFGCLTVQAAPESGSTAAADGSSNTAAAGLPDTGADAAKLLGAGLGLVLGGLVLAGTGRHRRTRRDRFASI